MNKPTIKQKLHYYFENTLSKGPTSLIKWLAIFSLIIVIILGAIIAVFGIKSEPDGESLSFLEGTWKSLMATLDPGTMGGDEGWPFRIIRFLATLAGLFVVAILIGAIGSAIDEALNELKKGKSKVFEENHTLILGWSEKIFTILQEIIIANENQQKPMIVILANKPKEEMEDEINTKVSDTKNTKIVIRTGNPLEATDVAITNPDKARSIIILVDENSNNPDIQTIKTVLSLTNGKNRKSEPYNIVAEIIDNSNAEAAELVGGTEAEYIFSDDIIAKLTAQTCLQSGLSIIYSELLQFEGDEIYFSEEHKLIGKTYKEAVLAYETSSIIGIFTENNQVYLNPLPETILKKGDKIIAISEDDDTIILSEKNNIQTAEHLIVHNDNNEISTQKTLILGWNHRAANIITEIDNYVSKQSEILIVTNSDISAQTKSLQDSLQNQTIQLKYGDITSKSLLEEIYPEKFNHIILLSDITIEDIQEADAKTLICLLHLRNISEKLNMNFNIVSEILDIRNRELGEIAKADDFIVSDNLISLLISQIAENKHLKKVYDSIFESEGSEIYLKPVSRYIKTNEPVDFYTIVQSAAQLNETAIGYRIQNDSHNADNKFGVILNPNKSKNIIFSPEDKIIVLAED